MKIRTRTVFAIAVFVVSGLLHISYLTAVTSQKTEQHVRSIVESPLKYVSLLTVILLFGLAFVPIKSEEEQ